MYSRRLCELTQVGIDSDVAVRDHAQLLAYEGILEST